MDIAIRIWATLLLSFAMVSVAGCATSSPMMDLLTGGETKREVAEREAAAAAKRERLDALERERREAELVENLRRGHEKAAEIRAEKEARDAANALRKAQDDELRAKLPCSTVRITGAACATPLEYHALGRINDSVIRYGMKVQANPFRCDHSGCFGCLFGFGRPAQIVAAHARHGDASEALEARSDFPIYTLGQMLTAQFQLPFDAFLLTTAVTFTSGKVDGPFQERVTVVSGIDSLQCIQ